jgi:hypothetical protein
LSYANIHKQISDSKDWAALFAVKSIGPSACVVYSMMWPSCSPYAILSGNERTLQGSVCPELEMSSSRFRQVLALLVDRGFIHEYEVEGRRYLYLLKFHKHNTPTWSRVGQPADPLPDCWEPPGHFLRFLQSEKPKDVDSPAFKWWNRVLNEHSETGQVPTQVSSQVIARVSMLPPTPTPTPTLETPTLERGGNSSEPGGLSPMLSTIPESESLNVISEPENGNGADPAVTQACANVSFLVAEGQELTPQLVRDACKPTQSASGLSRWSWRSTGSRRKGRGRRS